jgi:hypothetical protein
LLTQFTARENKTVFDAFGVPPVLLNEDQVDKDANDDEVANPDMDDDEDSKLIKSLQEQLSKAKTSLKKKTLQLKIRTRECTALEIQSAADAKRLLRSILLNIRSETKGIAFQMKDLDIEFPLMDQLEYETEFRRRLVLRLIDKPKGYREYEWYFDHIKDQGQMLVTMETARINAAIEEYSKATKKELKSGKAMTKLQLEIPTMNPTFEKVAALETNQYYEEQEHGYDTDTKKRIHKLGLELARVSKTGGKSEDATKYFQGLVQFHDSFDGLWRFLLERALHRDMVERKLLEEWWQDPETHFHNLSLRKIMELEKNTPSSGIVPGKDASQSESMEDASQTESMEVDDVSEVRKAEPTEGKSNEEEKTSGQEPFGDTTMSKETESVSQIVQIKLFKSTNYNYRNISNSRIEKCIFDYFRRPTARQLNCHKSLRQLNCHKSLTNHWEFKQRESAPSAPRVKNGKSWMLTWLIANARTTRGNLVLVYALTARYHTIHQKP